MYGSMSFLLILGLLAGCSPKKPAFMEVAANKRAIQNLVTDMWKAGATRDLPAWRDLTTKSNDLLFLGTDSAEIITNAQQWETQAKYDWGAIQQMKIGELRNVSVLLSEDATLGSILCETPVDMTVGGQPRHSLFRYAATARKENGEWKLVHGMAAIVTTGESSAEIAARMKVEGYSN